MGLRRVMAACEVLPALPPRRQEADAPPRRRRPLVCRRCRSLPHSTSAQIGSSCILLFLHVFPLLFSLGRLHLSLSLHILCTGRSLLEESEGSRHRYLSRLHRLRPRTVRQYAAPSLGIFGNCWSGLGLIVWGPPSASPVRYPRRPSGWMHTRALRLPCTQHRAVVAWDWGKAASRYHVLV